VVTFKNARRAVEVAEWIPLDRLLIETDCPFMAPEPFRGRRCDSTMVPKVAEKVAQLRGLPVEAVAKATRENAMKLFGVPGIQ
jgi:TatD DNase family protein